MPSPGDGSETAGDATLAAATAAFLRACGLDPDGDADLRDTPARVARLWRAEFLAGYTMSPAAIVGDRILYGFNRGGYRLHTVALSTLGP